MSSTEQERQHQGMKRHEREMLHALIGERVMHALGEPNNLCKLLVHRLWEHHYRVNVLVGESIAAAKIANSYFVQTDGDGNIVKATPNITRQY